MLKLSISELENYLSKLPRGIVDWNELSPASEDIQRAPHFVLGDMQPELCGHLLSEFLTGPVRLYAMRDACMTHDGIIIHGTTALSSMMFNHPSYHVKRIVADKLAGTMSLPIRHIRGRAASLSGPGYNVYGHWLVDMLPRLWILYKSGFEPSEMKYVIPLQCPKFVLSLLDWFGIGAHQIEFYDEQLEIIHVEELLIPTNMRRGSRLHRLMLPARDYLLKRHMGPSLCQGRTPERIFISRHNADASRLLLNRESIESTAKDHGYTVAYPEQMTMSEQVQLFQQADAVVGEYGSGLHNSLFSKPGTVVCAIRGTSAHPGFVQSAIGDVCRHHTGYVLAKTAIDAVHQSFHVSEQAFGLALKCIDLLVEQGRAGPLMRGAPNQAGNAVDVE